MEFFLTSCAQIKRMRSFGRSVSMPDKLIDVVSDRALRQSKMRSHEIIFSQSQNCMTIHIQNIRREASAYWSRQ